MVKGPQQVLLFCPKLELLTDQGGFVLFVQVDVLETQFSQLLERVKNTHDFESITFAHEQFLAALQVQLFINMPKVNYYLACCLLRSS